jgi:5-methylcytosine-specific restriction endonuclease McrA
MKKYVKTYLDYFGYDETSWIPCEMCGQTANDIHHIEARGMGGSKTKDTIENLQALCRKCHMQLGDKKEHKVMLKVVHQVKMNERKKWQQYQ